MTPGFNSRERCAVCDASTARVLLRVPFNDPDIRQPMERFYAEVGRYDADALSHEIFEIRECSSCQFVYQTHVPNDALMRMVYETWHDDQKTLAHWTGKLDTARRLEIAREVALAWNIARRDRAPLRMLDYGCGMGLWGGMARAFGAEVWGMEYSASRRAYCAAVGLRMCDDSALPSDYFDYIHLDQVLEHVESPRLLVSKLSRCLRPGGVICIAVPQGRRVKHALSNWRREINRPNLGEFNPVTPLFHLNCFTQKNLTLLASQFGLLRVRPSWQALWPMWAWPPGITAKLKSLARPVYLRTARTTRVFLSRAVESS